LNLNSMSEYDDDNFDDSPVKDQDLQRASGGKTAPSKGQARTLGKTTSTNASTGKPEMVGNQTKEALAKKYSPA